MRQLDNTRLAHQIMFSKLENFASKKDVEEDEAPKKKKKKGFFRRHPLLTTLGALTVGGLGAYGLSKTPIGKTLIDKAKGGLNSKFGDKDWYKSAKETYHKAGDLAAKGVDKAKNLAGKAKNKVSDSIYNKFYKKRTDAAVADAEDKLIKDREEQIRDLQEQGEKAKTNQQAEFEKQIADLKAQHDKEISDLNTKHSDEMNATEAGRAREDLSELQKKYDELQEKYNLSKTNLGHANEILTEMQREQAQKERPSTIGSPFGPKIDENGIDLAGYYAPKAGEFKLPNTANSYSPTSIGMMRSSMLNNPTVANESFEAKQARWAAADETAKKSAPKFNLKNFLGGWGQ